MLSKRPPDEETRAYLAIAQPAVTLGRRWSDAANLTFVLAVLVGLAAAVCVVTSGSVPGWPVLLFFGLLATSFVCSRISVRYNTRAMRAHETHITPWQTEQPAPASVVRHLSEHQRRADRS